jgi:hypothetical protein
MSSARLASPARGVALILLSALCIGAWAVHVFVLISIARLHQQHSDLIWVIQGATVVTAIPCAVTVAIAWSWLRGTTTPGNEGSPVGRTVFLCWLALFIGICNLVLIGLEATFVSLLHGYA